LVIAPFSGLVSVTVILACAAFFAGSRINF